MATDPLLEAARIPVDIASVGVRIWHEMLEQTVQQQRERAAQGIETRLADLWVPGISAKTEHAEPAWTRLSQHNLELSVELSKSAWDAFYVTQQNLLQLCGELAMDQGQTLNTCLDLWLDSLGSTTPEQPPAPPSAAPEKAVLASQPEEPSA